MAEGDRAPPPHSDAPWINTPVLFISGPLRGKWIRAELVVQQQPKRGRKGAIHDLRPVHPPPTVRLRLFEVDHPVPPASIRPGSNPEVLDFYSVPTPPPRDARETPIPIVPRLTTHFLCFASLFKAHPPTREEEYGRVEKKVMMGPSEGSSMSSAPHYGPHSIPGELIERPKSDRSRGWKAVRPHPMTALSCKDPRWNLALQEARGRLQREGQPSSPLRADFDTSQDSVRGIETIEGDLSLTDMLLLEPYLPRETPKWVIPYRDVTAHLSKRETAGHLIPSFENGENALYFVFSDLAIRNEGYFSLRFHVINLDWRVDSRFTKPGAGIFAPLADCVTDTFAVYSTKEFPGLPPTTEFTSYLVRQGVRIRFRDDRAVDAAVGDTRARGDGKKRTGRRGSGVQKAESDDGEVASSSAMSVGQGASVTAPTRQDSDAWSPSMLEAANEVAEEVWRNRSGSSVLAASFGHISVNEVDVPHISTPNHNRPSQMSASNDLSGSTAMPLFSRDLPRNGHSQSSPSIFVSPNVPQGRFESSSPVERPNLRALYPSNLPGSPNHLMFPVSPTDNSPTMYYPPQSQEPSQGSPLHQWPPHNPHQYSYIQTGDASPTGHGWSQNDEAARSSPLTMSGSLPLHQSHTRDRSNHRYYPYPPLAAQGMSSPQQEFPPAHDRPLQPHPYRGSSGYYDTAPPDTYPSFEGDSQLSDIRNDRRE